MEGMHPPNARRDRMRGQASPRPDMNRLDLDELRAENKQLRELVVQLSEIVVRSVLERK
jgi:hypothetical protein